MEMTGLRAQQVMIMVMQCDADAVSMQVLASYDAYKYKELHMTKATMMMMMVVMVVMMMMSTPTSPG